MRCATGWCTAFLLATALARAPAQSTPTPAPISDRRFSAYLRERLGLTDEEIGRAASGAAVVKALTGATGEEIALAGVVRIGAPPMRVASRFLEVGTSMRTGEVVQLGTFSSPPTARDVAAFTLPNEDVGALRGECTVGACVLKLPAELISQLRALDWRASESRARASGVIGDWMVNYTRPYLERGNQALVIYNDASAPLALHEGFHALLAESPYLLELVPEFHHYLDAYPAQRPAAMHDTLYWTVSEFGLRPLITITHASLLERAPGSDPRALIALKQIYASHYFHSALTVLELVDDGEGGTYVVALDRSLFDTKLGGFTRRRVDGRLRDALRSRLASWQRVTSAP